MFFINGNDFPTSTFPTSFSVIPDGSDLTLNQPVGVSRIVTYGFLGTPVAEAAGDGDPEALGLAFGVGEGDLSEGEDDGEGVATTAEVVASGSLSTDFATSLSFASLAEIVSLWPAIALMGMANCL